MVTAGAVNGQRRGLGGGAKGLAMDVAEGQAKLERQGSVSDTLTYDAKRGLVWDLNAYKKIYVLRIDPATLTLFDDPAKLMSGLQHFRYLRHEVIVFQILDDFETKFPFDSMTQFEGFEGWKELICDPRSLRKGYLEEYHEFTDKMKRGCRNNKIDFVPISTSQPLDVMLSAYLAARMNSRAK